MYGLFSWDWSELAETTLEILGLFHHILPYIVHYSRITAIKIQYSVNFLVDDLYNIIIRRKNAEYQKV